MKLELILIFLQKLSCTAMVITLLYTVGFVITLVVTSCDSYMEKELKEVKANFKKSLPFAIIALLVAFIPSPKEILKMRLSLIAIEPSSPENVEKGTAKIEEIAKKLECKYLGCAEEK